MFNLITTIYYCLIEINWLFWSYYLYYIYDKKENKVYFSKGKFVLNNKTDINQKLSSQKFEYIQVPIDEKTNSNVKISTNIVDGENIINVKEVIKEKIRILKKWSKKFLSDKECFCREPKR